MPGAWWLWTNGLRRGPDKNIRDERAAADQAGAALYGLAWPAGLTHNPGETACFRQAASGIERPANNVKPAAGACQLENVNPLGGQWKMASNLCPTP